MKNSYSRSLLSLLKSTWTHIGAKARWLFLGETDTGESVVEAAGKGEADVIDTLYEINKKYRRVLVVLAALLLANIKNNLKIVLSYARLYT